MYPVEHQKYHEPLTRLHHLLQLSVALLLTIALSIFVNHHVLHNDGDCEVIADGVLCQMLLRSPKSRLPIVSSDLFLWISLPPSVLAVFYS